MDAVDVLMEARAYIEKGWCRGSLGRDQLGMEVAWHALAGATEVCAVGAVYKGASPVKDHAEAHSGAFSLLFEVLGGYHPATWNDAPGRTQEEVLEVFDRAIGLGLERAGER